MNLNNILFIDTSYVIFYRFYATIFWFKSSKQKINIPKNYNWIEDEIFVEKFSKMFMESIEKIMKKNKLKIPYENWVFALDCPRKEIWRYELFQEYKSQRDIIYQSDEWKGGPIFELVINKLLPELQKKLKFTVLKHEKLEADDIIACLTQTIQTENKDCLIYIITNDHDYLQLINPMTTIINLKNKKLNDKSCGNPNHDLLLKIICGDPADNIKGCFKRCGKKTAMKLIHNRELLDKKFNDNPESKIIFENNKQLISFESIPKYLKISVINIFKSIFKIT